MGACLYRLKVAVFLLPATLMGPMAFRCWQISYAPIIGVVEKKNVEVLVHKVGRGIK